MKHHILNHVRLYCALFAVAVIIFSLVRIATIDAKPEPSLQAKAAADLPRVVSVLEETKAAHDRYENALVYRTQLLDCIEGRDCSVLGGPKVFPTR